MKTKIDFQLRFVPVANHIEWRNSFETKQLKWNITYTISPVTNMCETGVMQLSVAHATPWLKAITDHTVWLGRHSNHP